MLVDSVKTELLLPPVISSPDDVYSFSSLDVAPTFLGSRKVLARVSKACSSELAGSVVCIPNADPGWDWLFTRDIAALVTCFGGPNSHMSIRAAELELPAVIGVGDVQFQRFSAAHGLFIDCGAEFVTLMDPEVMVKSSC